MSTPDNSEILSHEKIESLVDAQGQFDPHLFLNGVESIIDRIEPSIFDIGKIYLNNTRAVMKHFNNPDITVQLIAGASGQDRADNFIGNFRILLTDPLDQAKHFPFVESRGILSGKELISLARLIANDGTIVPAFGYKGLPHLTNVFKGGKLDGVSRELQATVFEQDEAFYNRGLQSLLVDAGYDIGCKSDGTPAIDGDLGKDTVAAQHRIAQDWGLEEYFEYKPFFDKMEVLQKEAEERGIERGGWQNDSCFADTLDIENKGSQSLEQPETPKLGESFSSSVSPEKSDSSGAPVGNVTREVAIGNNEFKM